MIIRELSLYIQLTDPSALLISSAVKVNVQTKMNATTAWSTKITVASITLFHQLKIQPPSWLEEQVPPTSSFQTGRRRKSEQLLLPKWRTKRLSNSFFYHTSLLWNSLPANIQNLQKSEDFKSAVEQHWAALKFRTSADIPLPMIYKRRYG